MIDVIISKIMNSIGETADHGQTNNLKWTMMDILSLSLPSTDLPKLNS